MRKKGGEKAKPSPETSARGYSERANPNIACFTIAAHYSPARGSARSGSLAQYHPSRDSMGECETSKMPSFEAGTARLF